MFTPTCVKYMYFLYFKSKIALWVKMLYRNDYLTVVLFLARLQMSSKLLSYPQRHCCWFLKTKTLTLLLPPSEICWPLTTLVELNLYMWTINNSIMFSYCRPRVAVDQPRRSDLFRMLWHTSTVRCTYFKNAESSHRWTRNLTTSGKKLCKYRVYPKTCNNLRKLEKKNFRNKRLC